MEISETENKKCVELFKNISKNADFLTKKSNEILKSLKGKSFDLSQGHNFLDVKINLLLSYIINVGVVSLEKVNGKSLINNRNVWNLIELRTIIEKMRPLEKKLKFELERKMNQAISGSIDKNDPMNLTPDLDNLMDEEEEENNEKDDEEKEEEGEGREGKGKGKGEAELYRPPKLIPKFYDGDMSTKEKKEREMEKVRERAVKSSIIKELRREFIDQPEEIRDGTGIRKSKILEKQKERQDYEEKYFTRIQLSKKDKMANKKLESIDGLSSLGRFSDLAPLTGEDMPGKKSSKKRKTQFKKKGKKKRKFH